MLSGRAGRMALMQPPRDPRGEHKPGAGAHRRMEVARVGADDADRISANSRTRIAAAVSQCRAIEIQPYPPSRSAPRSLPRPTLLQPSAVAGRRQPVPAASLRRRTWRWRRSPRASATAPIAGISPLPCAMVRAIWARIVAAGERRRAPPAVRRRSGRGRRRRCGRTPSRPSRQLGARCVDARRRRDRCARRHGRGDATAAPSTPSPSVSAMSSAGLPRAETATTITCRPL